MEGWSARVPRLRAQLDQVRQLMWETFPNERDGAAFSGSYWNEADYDEPDWQTSFWGEENYAKLLVVKKAVDPDGMFTCHHCVGSELRSADGNCAL